MQLFKKKAYTLYYPEECFNCTEQDVTIGTQVWTKCNLAVTTYRDGGEIFEVSDPTGWANLTVGAWCHVDGNPANDAIYGKLYNWYAVSDPRGLGPVGYHVPTVIERDALITYLGGSSVAGGKMKEVGTCHWLSPNVGATNESGFTAFGAGVRDYDGSYRDFNYLGWFWTITDFNTTLANAFGASSAFDDLMAIGGLHDKKMGYSVRLIQDEILSCLTIEIYPPILNPGTSHVVEYLDCDGISQIVTVPDGGTMVTICATEIIANNLNGLTQPLYTLCSPPEPLVCSTYSVAPGYDNDPNDGYLGYNIVNYLDCEGNPQTISVASNESTQYICATEITGGNMGGGAVLETEGTCTIQLNFSLSQTCDGLNITLVADNVTGGNGPYVFSTVAFTDATSAIDNLVWTTPRTFKNYYIGNVPGTYWVSIKDINGLIIIQEIFADCWDPEAVTRYQVSVSSSTAATSNGVCAFSLQTVWIATRSPLYAQVDDVVFTAQTGPTRYDGSVNVVIGDWRTYDSSPSLLNSNACFGDPNCSEYWTEAIRISPSGIILELGCCNPPC